MKRLIQIVAAMVVITIMAECATTYITKNNHSIFLKFKERGWFQRNIHEKLFLVINGKKKLLTKYGSEGWAEISKDGLHVLYVDSRETSRLILFNVAQQTRLPIMTNTSSFFFCSWSPDCKAFAFTVQDNGTSFVYISSCPLGTLKCIAHDIGWGGHVHWSPDGKWIAFYSSDERGSYVRLYDTEEEKLVYKSPNVGNGWMIQWDLKNWVSFPIEGKGQVFVIPKIGVHQEGWIVNPKENRLVAGWPTIEN